MTQGRRTLLHLLLVTAVYIARSEPEDELIPADKSQLDTWFNRNVGQKATLSTAVADAEAKTTVISVSKDGSGKFKTIGDALKSVPENNKNRVVIHIGPGNYTEKIRIERSKPHVTLYGDPKNMPVLVYGESAAKVNIIESATLIVEGDYFSAVNLVIVNSSPRPDGKIKLAQAAALRTSGDGASFYNCRFHGFQDTILDDAGRHLFKDCYIEGTVDFICGSGQSLYLNTEVHVIPGEPMGFITAHARKTTGDPGGYSFVHCRITGAGETAYLGRPWYPYARVIYSYSQLSDVVNPSGWSNGGNSN
ncbi:hypothetical protein M569_05334, partial [Genlisea aurea]